MVRRLEHRLDCCHKMIMKSPIRQITVLCWLIWLIVWLQVGEGSSIEGALSEVTMRLFQADSTSDEEFNSILKEARHLGLSRQLLLEAQVSRYWKADEFDRLVELLPVFEELLDEWDLQKGKIFRDQHEVLGYYNFFRAVEALKEDNLDKLEFHAKESYWNSPDMASILTILIKDRREEDRMANLEFPMGLELVTSQGEEVTLGELISNKKGALLEFWASWCGPCIALMPELVRKAEKFQPQGLLVVGLNTESKAIAEEFRIQQEIEFPWLVEPQGNPLQRLLPVDSLPHAVLVNPEGQVLFNGHPMDPTLKKVLVQLNLNL